MENYGLMTTNDSCSSQQPAYSIQPSQSALPTSTEMKNTVSKHKPAFTKWLKSQTSSIEVAHREWPYLDTLDRITILGWLMALQTRCAETRKPFETAVAELDIRTKILTQTSLTTSNVVDYLQIFGNAQAAAHAISGPQAAHASAVRTLRLLVADMIDMMPAGALKKGLRQDFWDAEDKENSTEVKTRNVLNYLGDDGREGKAQHALQAYVSFVRGRLIRWDELRIRLEDCSTQCMNDGLP